jgi:hypothetical protein
MKAVNNLEAALHYAAQGIAVLPLHHINETGACSCGKTSGCKPGKHPQARLVRNGLNDASADIEVIRHWFSGTQHNVGLRTGTENGLFVLDRDDRDGGEKGLAELESRFGTLPSTITQRTGGGRHYFFRYPEGRSVRNSVKKLGPGLDIRGDGGYVVAAPSNHFSGNDYAWEDDALPDFGKLADAPTWLLDLIEGKSNATPVASGLVAKICGGITSFAMPERVEDGQGREDIILRAAGHYRGMGVEQAEIERRLIDYNKLHIVPPLDDEVVLDRARRYEVPGATLSDWPTPDELPSALPPVMAFDLDLLPEVLRPAVADAADLMQVPPDFLAVSYMVSAAAALGLTVSIAPKAQDSSWFVPPVLWGALIGSPSTKKTPCLSKATLPLKVIETELLSAHTAKMRQFEGDVAQFEQLVKAAKKHGQPLPPRPVEPIAERLLLNDATYQATGVALRGSPRGVLLVMDELTGWLTSMDSSSQESSRAFYLSAWNGTEAYRFDRVGRDNFIVDPLAVSILGGIQPNKLESYTRGAIQGRGDDGLLQRFQLAVYPDQNPEWKLVDRMENYPAQTAAADAIIRLRALTPNDLGAKQSLTGRAYLQFDPEAQEAFNSVYGALETLSRSGSLEPAMEAHLGKFPRMIAALALVIHLTDSGVGPIPLNVILKAVKWATYLKSHALRIYGSPASRTTRSAQALAGKICDGKLSDGFTARDVTRHGWRDLTSKDDVESALDLLEVKGWLRHLPEANMGRPKTAYAINPLIKLET